MCWNLGSVRCDLLLNWGTGPHWQQQQQSGNSAPVPPHVKPSQDSRRARTPRVVHVLSKSLSQGPRRGSVRPLEAWRRGLEGVQGAAWWGYWAECLTVMD